MTSQESSEYNCIAWGAEDTLRWWWPSPDYHWPEGAPREETVEAFVEAFGTLGYHECEDASLEPGFEKVAVYVKDGVPAHAARQLDNGRWTSKLGGWEDVEHASLDDVAGELYGSAVVILRRRLPRT